MTLGSLFDGSGGFPLAGLINGVTPVWASEIEPYPLKVTAARFPTMKQLGDVTKINGAEIQPVDVITFGSPCQDLSVAGAQKGIHDGERSNLFFEAIRIIREMRGVTDGKYPRFAVWENVPGAFSSNKGQDFRAVLEAFCQVCDPEVSVPEPPKGKWQPAGCIVGDGYSIAWRVYDAQYWGVPQRRKRIYLVADFAGERAGEILFEREGMRRDSAPSREAREEAADDAEGSAGGSGGVECLTNRGYPCGGICETLRAGSHGAIPMIAAFMGGQGAKAGSIAYDESISPTLRATASGSNQVPDVVYACNAKQQSLNIAEKRANTLGANDYKELQVVVYPEIARTLTAEHDASPCADRGQNVVVLDCRNIVGNSEISATIQAKNEGGFSLNFINPIVYEQQRIGVYGQSGCASTLMARDYKSAKDLVVENNVSPRKYIVRRLTPLECCRLQGFPDWWEDGVEGSDSARYKMWGNGIALPCAVDVLRRIAEAGA